MKNPLIITVLICLAAGALYCSYKWGAANQWYADQTVISSLKEGQTQAATKLLSDEQQILKLSQEAKTNGWNNYFAETKRSYDLQTDNAKLYGAMRANGQEAGACEIQLRKARDIQAQQGTEAALKFLEALLLH